MTKEEIIEAVSDDKMMPYIEPYQLSEIVNFVIKNYKPSLPSNLDEAAEEVMPISYGSLEVDCYGGSEPVYSREQMVEMFKAGSEWMTLQGVNADFEVCKLANRAWLTPIEEKRFAQDIYDNFTAGDKVVVQIRKA